MTIQLLQIRRRTTDTASMLLHGGRDANGARMPLSEIEQIAAQEMREQDPGDVFILAASKSR